MSKAITVTEAEIDEAVAQIMDLAGVTDRGNCWAWRELRDYAKDVEDIIGRMLSGEFKQEEEGK